MKRIITPIILLLTLSVVSQNLNYINKADKLIARSASASSKDISDDLVYIVNGFSTTNQYTSEIEVYNLYNDSWSLFTPSIPTIPKKFGNAEIIGDYLYILNGATASGNNDKLEIIDLTSGNLSINSTLNPNPVYSAGTSTFGDYIVVFGGRVNKFNAVFSKKTYMISPWGDWTQLADMPVGLETKGEVIYNSTNSKLYAFGGFKETNNTTENFAGIAVNSDIVITDWFNVAESGTKLFEGKTYNSNKYAQITAYDSNVANQEPINISWLISNSLTSLSTDQVFLNFDTKDGYDNGATLEAYLITNWTGDISTSTKTVLSANISSGNSSGYATDFTHSGNIPLSGNLSNFRIGFKYTGGYSTSQTTTFQIDNFRVYKTTVSNNIYVYDFDSNTWSISPIILPISLSGYSVARDNFSNDKLYISGDYDNQTFNGVFNTTNNTFTTLSQTNMIGRRHHTSEFWNNNLYIFGGNVTSSISSSLVSTQSADLSTLDIEKFDKTEFTFYPNPVETEIFFSNNLKKLSIYSYDGKKVMEKSNIQVLDISDLIAGVYFIIGECDNDKIIKEKFIKK